MIFEKNAKIGELVFSKSFYWWYLFAVFDDLERVMMSSEVFLNGNVAFLLPFLIDLLIVYPTIKKNFNLHTYLRNFLKKPNWLLLENKENFNFERQL
jgi:hypothetical protein